MPYLLSGQRAVVDAILATDNGVTVHPELVERQGILLERLGRRVASGERPRFNLPGESDDVAALCELERRELVTLDVALYPGRRLRIDARPTQAGVDLLTEAGVGTGMLGLSLHDSPVWAATLSDYMSSAPAGVVPLWLGHMSRRSEVLEYARRRDIDPGDAIIELVNHGLSHGALADLDEENQA